MISLGDINPEGLANHLGKFKDRYDRIIGFRPTGWTCVTPVALLAALFRTRTPAEADLPIDPHRFGGAAGTTQTPDLATLIARDRAATESFDAKDIKPTRGSNDRVQMFGVPYSEHSSFGDLTCFCLSVPGEPRIIPTVNVGSVTSREKMEVWIKRWATEKRKRAALGLKMVDYRSLDYVRASPRSPHSSAPLTDELSGVSLLTLPHAVVISLTRVHFPCSQPSRPRTSLYFASTPVVSV